MSNKKKKTSHRSSIVLLHERAKASFVYRNGC